MRGWAAFSNLLCDKSSIYSIYESNHTLESIGPESELPFDIASYLEMNQNENKAEVARQKLLHYHFLDGDVKLDYFLGLELNVIPHAIAWIVRDDTGLPLLHQLAKSMPSVFDY